MGGEVEGALVALMEAVGVVTAVLVGAFVLRGVVGATYTRDAAHTCDTRPGSQPNSKQLLALRNCGACSWILNASNAGSDTRGSMGVGGSASAQHVTCNEAALRSQWALLGSRAFLSLREANSGQSISTDALLFTFFEQTSDAHTRTLPQPWRALSFLCAKSSAVVQRRAPIDSHAVDAAHQSSGARHCPPTLVSMHTSCMFLIVGQP